MRIGSLSDLVPFRNQTIFRCRAVWDDSPYNDTIVDVCKLQANTHNDSFRFDILVCQPHQFVVGSLSTQEQSVSDCPLHCWRKLSTATKFKPVKFVSGTNQKQHPIHPIHTFLPRHTVSWRKSADCSSTALTRKSAISHHFRSQSETKRWQR